MGDEVFNEDSLRAAIVETWGEHGAHVDLFDFMLTVIRSSGDEIERLSAKIEAQSEWIGARYEQVSTGLDQLTVAIDQFRRKHEAPIRRPDHHHSKCPECGLSSDVVERQRQVGAAMGNWHRYSFPESCTTCRGLGPDHQAQEGTDD